MAPSNDTNTSDTEPSDIELVTRCQAGDTEAFNVLVTRYRQRAYAMIYQMVRNEQDAWDLAQDGFIRAWKAIRRFKGDAAFYTWLYRIMTNVTIDWLRKKQRVTEQEFDEAIDRSEEMLPGEMTQLTDTPSTELERSELKKRIEEALAKLSPNHRAVITLKEIDGLQYNEIAEIMDCSIGTVMSRLFHARRNLQQMLASTYEKL